MPRLPRQQYQGSSHMPDWPTPSIHGIIHRQHVMHTVQAEHIRTDNQSCQPTTLAEAKVAYASLVGHLLAPKHEITVTSSMAAAAGTNMWTRVCTPGGIVQCLMCCNTAQLAIYIIWLPCKPTTAHVGSKDSRPPPPKQYCRYSYPLMATRPDANQATNAQHTASAMDADLPRAQ